MARNLTSNGNKLAWITGAGRGIGRSLAQHLVASAWTVVVTSRTKSELLSLEKESRDLEGKIITCPADIRDPEKIKQLIKHIHSEIGEIDLAILNAGNYIQFGVNEFSATAFKEQIDINILGTVNCLTPVMHRMKNQGKGHIVVMSSLNAYRGLPLASAYGASKAALTNMCEALKPELDKFDVKISVVHPGFVRTPLTDKNDFKMPFLVDTDFACKRIIRGISKGRFEIVFPSRFAFILKLLRCLPYFLYFAVTRRIISK